MSFQPQFANTPPPRNKPGAGKVIGIVALFILVPCCGLGFFAYQAAKSAIGIVGKNMMPVVACVTNVELLQKAAEEYASEHDGKFPDASNWQSSLEAYYRKRAGTKMSKEPVDVLGTKIEMKPLPKDGQWNCINTPELKTGLTYNSDVAGKTKKEIKATATTVLFYETPETGMNLAAPYATPPANKRPFGFGSKRDWYFIMVDGTDNKDSVVSPGKNGTKVTIDTGSDNKSDKKSDKDSESL